MTGNSVNSEQFFGKFFSHSPGRTDVLSNDTSSKFLLQYISKQKQNKITTNQNTNKKIAKA